MFPPKLFARRSCLLPLLLASTFTNSPADQRVRIWEETINLPTYKVAPADPNPRFYSGRTYQGAKATFYPYPVSDQMTEIRENQAYKAVYLENQYIRISMLPELGGRIFTALDKGNNYDFFYRQHVIKPALIGMLGAWISGGVEWNIPHHHRASSFMPVDYALRENPDGSKTLWLGETELRHRLKWIIGLTLKPDRSWVEMTVKVFNRTPAAQSFLFWINPAVHANTNYQVIFPPSTEWAVQHGKPEFAAWPMARQFYGGTDYTRGVDISWWKNHPSPVSFFAWDCQEDFFGGYDHGRQAGVIQISDHHVSPGKKFFEWGNGAEGQMWEKILSDADGPYLELMAGSYSDNQPDYSWCQPAEVKVFTHYWYPVRGLGGIKNANMDAAVNLEVSNRTARIAFNTTSAHPRAQARLESGDRVLLSAPIRITPQEPFSAFVPLPDGVSEETLRASLVAQGRELIAYQPIPKPGTEKPKPVDRPRAPKDLTGTEELYFTGQRIEQLYSPAYEPEAYYSEALRRDAGDYRANTALGGLLCRQGRFEEAEVVLRSAIQRASANYIRSKECEAQYYLGVALRAQGKPQSASEAFYRAIWSQTWQPAGYCALAELACDSGHFDRALELVERSLACGALNTRALELKLSILRRLDRGSQARVVAAELFRVDPLNPRALYEQSLLRRKSSKPPALASRSEKPDSSLRPLLRLMRGEATSYLELALGYASAGLTEEAADILEIYAHQAHAMPVSPLAHYYLAYLYGRLSRADISDAELKAGSKANPHLCFPFQHEAEPILRYAMAKNPKDPKAPYYLGNLLYDNQPLKALELWEQSVQLDPNFALAQRNLGLARAQAKKDLPGAIASLEKAVALEPGDPRLLYELDVLYEAAGTAIEKRLALLNVRPDVAAERDDTVTRRLNLLIASGAASQALQILRERHFHNWEGSSGLHDVYVDACLQTGLQHLRAGRADKAAEAFEAAKEYPPNQEVGKPRREQRVAAINFLIGEAMTALEHRDQAMAAYEHAARSGDNSPSEAAYYKGLALQKLGDAKEAAEVFKRLEQNGLEEARRDNDAVDYFAKFGEKRTERIRHAQGFYLAGLGCLGLEKSQEAQDHFRRALELHPAHLGAVSMLRKTTNE